MFSQDVNVPPRVALALESGSVWVNDWTKPHDQFEEGGFKGLLKEKIQTEFQ